MCVDVFVCVCTCTCREVIFYIFYIHIYIYILDTYLFIYLSHNESSQGQARSELKVLLPVWIPPPRYHTISWFVPCRNCRHLEGFSLAILFLSTPFCKTLLPRWPLSLVVK